jgi:hypothetical protein
LFLSVIVFLVESLCRLLFFVAGELKSTPNIDGEGKSALDLDDVVDDELDPKIGSRSHRRSSEI